MRRNDRDNRNRRLTCTMLLVVGTLLLGGCVAPNYTWVHPDESGGGYYSGNDYYNNYGSAVPYYPGYGCGYYGCGHGYYPPSPNFNLGLGWGWPGYYGGWGGYHHHHHHNHPPTTRQPWRVPDNPPIPPVRGTRSRSADFAPVRIPRPDYDVTRRVLPSSQGAGPAPTRGQPRVMTHPVRPVPVRKQPIP